ncbi:hypothetical protein D3C81_1895060 [compost metagenome]
MAGRGPDNLGSRRESLRWVWCNQCAVLQVDLAGDHYQVSFFERVAQHLCADVGVGACAYGNEVRAQGAVGFAQGIDTLAS